MNVKMDIIFLLLKTMSMKILKQQTIIKIALKYVRIKLIIVMNVKEYQQNLPIPNISSVQNVIKQTEILYFQKTVIIKFIPAKKDKDIFIKSIYKVIQNNVHMVIL